jgi:hypothetical protein
MVTFRYLALVARREQEILAAAPLVGPGEAEVDDKVVPHVVDQPEHLRGHLEDQWAVVQIHPEPAVDRVVVRRQLHGARVHQLFPDRHGLVRWPHRQDGRAIRQLVHRRQREQIPLHGTLEIEVVVEHVGGGLIRYATVEAKRTQARFNLVGDSHIRWHRRRILVLRVGRWALEHLRHGWHCRQHDRNNDCPCKVC